MRSIFSFASIVLAVAMLCPLSLSQTPSSPVVKPTENESTAPAGSSSPKAAEPAQEAPAADDKAPKPKNDQPASTSDEVAQKVKQVKEIRDALSADSDLDFSLVVGVGSLIVVSGSTDYSDQSNVIHSNNLGKATPQFLTGVSFRSYLPNVLPRYHGCAWNGNTGTGSACSYAEPWQKRPWSAFVSLKFEPGSSQTISGYVFGASYSVTKYLNALVGFALTPVNEPAPGFRTTAAQFVIAQQKLGQDLNFNPTAMLKNSANAFDGFPVTDPSGKLLYSGNPLTVHYHGGAVFGVSIPIYFSSVFK